MFGQKTWIRTNLNSFKQGNHYNKRNRIVKSLLFTVKSSFGIDGSKLPLNNSDDAADPPTFFSR